MLRKLDELLLKQFQRLSNAIHRQTGISNFSIAKGLLFVGLAGCLSESILDFMYRTVDFETYFLLFYVLVVGVAVPPLLNTQQRIIGSRPTAPNRLSGNMAFFRNSTVVLCLFMLIRPFFNFHLDAILQAIPGLVERTSVEQFVLNEVDLLISLLFFYFASIKSTVPEKSAVAG